jgi:hypothetical protein
MCKGTYSPKISEDLIPALYQKAAMYGIRMTTLTNILIEEGLKNADITLALESRPERKKVKNAFKRHYDTAVARFLNG